MRRYPNSSDRVDDKEIVAIFEEKILVKVSHSLHRVILYILADRWEELIRRKWLTRTHDPLKSAICNSLFGIAHSIIDLIVCGFEIYRKFP
jgi:hypothetical protein